ncbi:ABC transporter permease [Lederbergia wuyishanensis]|uniref:ABC-2 type transport system permease protein n=1 Tax=Lederbergia wuyishanensis TaxID=1347903 RepID=A0ABU0DAX4_9BACI|nr:ABC transporter permease [Lederbergia wuyishanensis]MCJ8010059.1 ABC transporter permease [Lederbergia wuyishanensis]MDQ0345573.1 ABC-2 type transport system permease protein [Lederbergia wuyishanensis]
MRNSLKVAKWEIKRNMMNKSFIISLLLTPALFMFFFFVPQLFSGGDDNADTVKVFVLDELGVWDDVKAIVETQDLNWDLLLTEVTEPEMQEQVTDTENTVYIPLTEKTLNEGLINLYMSEDVSENFVYEAYTLEAPLRQLQIDRLGLSEEQKNVIAKGISVQQADLGEATSDGGTAENEAVDENDPLKRVIPGAFAGIILFSIVMTGMMIFTSASQEKKEKVAEIILSSVTPGELMQGKIIGYFVLGITQVVVWLAVGMPLVAWKLELPLMEYLLVPELLLLLLLAVSGYLLFSSIFVAIGATVEDMTATSNFQGIVMMLPFLPLIFIGPIISDPSGIIAKIGSFFPITSPAVWIIRLSMLDEWPWIEIIIALAILFVTIWLMMKAAGKIFKIGILMYGKNATPKEIWKWLWA